MKLSIEQAPRIQPTRIKLKEKIIHEYAHESRGQSSIKDVTKYVYVQTYDNQTTAHQSLTLLSNSPQNVYV